jgi:hypothetical protein
MSQLLRSPEQATRFLQRRLRPFREPELKQLRRWVADLDSDSFATRTQATAHLRCFPAEWEPFLRDALEDKLSLEAHKRLEAVLREARKITWPAGMLRRLRAVQLLEEIGTAEAQRTLTEIARGLPRARLTTEARRALQRLR